MPERTWLFIGVAFTLTLVAALSRFVEPGDPGPRTLSGLGERDHALMSADGRSTATTGAAAPSAVSFAAGGLRSDLVVVGDTVYFPVSNPAVRPIVQRRAQPPTAPVIIEPADHQRLELPPSREDPRPSGVRASLTSWAGFVVSGVAEPESRVELTGGGGPLLGWTVADAAGRWSIAHFSLDAFRRLRGEVTLTATATDASGNVSAPTTVQLMVAVGGVDDDWLQALFAGARPSPGR